MSKKPFEISPGNKNTLLSIFINGKIADYKEPQREGTPRGEMIGFSNLKYRASLLMITNLKQREISSMLEIPFGTLRNWNSEESFRDLVFMHCQEFANILVDHVKKEIAEHYEEFQNCLDGFSDEEPRYPVFDELKDAKVYGDCIKDLAKEKLLEPFMTITGKGSHTKVSWDFESKGSLELVLYRESFNIIFGNHPIKKETEKKILTSLTALSRSILQKYDLNRKDNWILSNTLLKIEEYLKAET